MNNKSKLIPRKLIGGLIPKFKNTPGKLMTRLEYERRYSNLNYNKAYMLNGKWQRAILNRDKNGNETVTLQTWKPLPENYYVKNGGIYKKTGLGDIRVDTYKGSRYESGKPALDHKRPVDRSATLAEINEVKALNANSKPANQNPRTKKETGRKGNRSISPRLTNRTSTITSKTAITPVSTITSVPASGNYTIQRGDTLSKLAQQYGTTVEELAKLNNISNVNRIYAGLNLILPSQFTGETVGAKPLTETFSDPTIKKSPTPYEHWYNQGGRLAYENDLVNNAFKTYDGSSLNDFTHIKDLETTQPKSLPNLNLQLNIPNTLLLNPELENRYKAYSKRFTFARKGTKLIPRNNGFK